MNYPGPAMRSGALNDDGFADSSSEQMAMRQYLFTVRKYLRPIIVFSAIVTCIAAYYALTATPIYRATATMLLEDQGANLVAFEELYGIDSENADYDETQFQVLRSRALAQRVIERLAMWENAELGGEPDAAGDEPAAEGGLVSGVKGLFGSETAGAAKQPDIDPADSLAAGEQRSIAGFRSPVHQEEVISAFLSRLDISPVRNTKLINISYESADPTLATIVANAVGEEYIQTVLDAKLALTSTASSWLSERLGDLRADVDEAETRLITFQRENNLIDIQGSVGRLSEQQLLLDTAELTQARSDLSAAADVLDDVQRFRGDTELLGTIPAIQLDALVQRTEIEQGSIQRELDELLTRYGERHPLVLDKKSELASLAGRLERHVNRAADTIVNNYEVARQRVATINSKLSNSRSEIQLIGDKKFELDALQREVDTKRRVHDQYFNRMTEAASKDGQERANARISDRARTPVRPVKPNKRLIIAAAAIGSLLIAVLFAFLREALDDTIKGTHDVESKLGLRLLGLLPMIKTGIIRKQTSLPLNPERIPDKRGTFAEAVNTIRTALTLNDQNSQRKIIVVTSSVRGEGKSTTALNIAYSLGQLERVLLIDCDMRRPSIGRAAGLRKSGKGLSNLITNTATAEQCIKRGKLGGNVDILPCGPIPAQPLELLSSKRFARIVTEVGHYYDRIVIDSAPTQAVSDALVLGRMADAVVYIVKSHDTPMNLVRRGVTRLQRAGAPIEGVVMTQVDIDKMNAYGGNYSYQGYHESTDAYRYTAEEEQAHSVVKLSSREIMDIRNDEGHINLGFSSMYKDVRVPRSSPGARTMVDRKVQPAAVRRRMKEALQVERS